MTRHTALSGLSQSLVFTGRASRAMYWGFFPVSVSLPILTAGAAWACGASLWLGMGLTLLAALPLFAAGARRLQDTGVAGEAAYAPWFTLAMGIALAHWAQASLTKLSDAFATPVPPDGPAGFGAVIQFGGGGAILAAGAMLCGLTFLIRLTPAVAQTFIPSQPGPNKYGPNPQEVPQ